jgi:hypothetical protein
MAHPARAETVPPRTGEVFTFHGLDDDPLDGRSVKIQGISVSGRVQFTISFIGQSARGLHDAPLTEVMALIAYGIWRRVDAQPT